MTANEQRASDSVVREQLNQLRQSIEDAFSADVLTLRSGLVYGLDDLVRQAIEAICPKENRLLVILETDGGSIDVAERIADTLRFHYPEVDFLIPNYAYSAGTILTMSGDSIYMDYYSVLGPIDPQIKKDGVGWVPALGYLLKYQELVERSARGLITNAEVAFLCERFDPAELHRFEQAKAQSITLLKEWLVKYKFKDWKVTETTRSTVTTEMKQQRAEEIAEQLNRTDLWHSHNRGIPMKALREVLRLKIEDFGSQPELNEPIRSYYRLLHDFLLRLGHGGILHTKCDFVPLVG